MYAPDPLAVIEAGGRPEKGLAAIKWGGGLIAAFALLRLLALKRVRAGPGGLVVSSLLKRKRHDWSALRQGELTRSGNYRLRLGPHSMLLPRSEYSPRAIASLHAIVQEHHGRGGGSAPP